MKLSCMTIAKASGCEAITTWEFASGVPDFLIMVLVITYPKKAITRILNYKTSRKIQEFVLSEFLRVIFSYIIWNHPLFPSCSLCNVSFKIHG